MATGCGKLGQTPQGHANAAREVVKLEFGPERMDRIAISYVDEQIRSGSVAENLKPVYISWFHDVFSDNAFIDRLAAIKMQHYSESELREIAHFYKTKPGQKFLRVEPIITDEVSAAGKANTQAHLPDLTSRLEKVMASPK
jgi:hypothetical protein